MGSAPFVIVVNGVAELATERPHFRFSVVPLKFVSANNLGNATVNSIELMLIITHLE